MGRKYKKQSAIKSVVSPGISSDQFFDPETTICLTRRYGGLGDILMTRPIFREIKETNEEMITHYRIPLAYIPCVIDSPYIDYFIPYGSFDIRFDYKWRGDISSACIEHERTFRQKVHKQRMDIWAEHVGLPLKNHRADLHLSEPEIESAKRILKRYRINEDKFFAISPHSADYTRNLTSTHVQTGIDWALANGYQPVIVNHARIPGFESVIQVFDLSIREWFALMTFSKMCFTTDTGALHLAGYLGVPTVALFNHTSGNVVPMYYPTVVPVQLHCDHPGGMECVPCYEWGNCRFLREDGIHPLKCFRDLKPDLIIPALDKCKKIQVRSYDFEIVESIDWGRILFPEVVSFVHTLKNEAALPWAERKHSRFIIETRDSSLYKQVSILLIAEALRSQNRNSEVFAIAPEIAHTPLTQHPFITQVISSYVKQDNDISINIDNFNSRRLSYFDFIKSHIGQDLKHKRFRQLSHWHPPTSPNYVNTLSTPLEGLEKEELSLDKTNVDESLRRIFFADFVVTNDFDVVMSASLMHKMVFYLTQDALTFAGIYEVYCLPIDFPAEELVKTIKWRTSNERA